MIGCEGRPPIHIYISLGVHHTIRRSGNHDEFFLNKQFGDQVRPLRRIVEDGEIERAILYAIKQASGSVHFCTKCYLWTFMVHPDEPVGQERMPKTEFSAHTHAILSSGW